MNNQWQRAQSWAFPEDVRTGHSHVAQRVHGATRGVGASPTGRGFCSLLSLSVSPLLQSEAQASPMPNIWESCGATFWEKGLGTDRQRIHISPFCLGKQSDGKESLHSLPEACTDYIQGREIIAAAGWFVQPQPAGISFIGRRGFHAVWQPPGDAGPGGSNYPGISEDRGRSGARFPTVFLITLFPSQRR